MRPSETLQLAINTLLSLPENILGEMPDHPGCFVRTDVAFRLGQAVMVVEKLEQLEAAARNYDGAAIRATLAKLDKLRGGEK